MRARRQRRSVIKLSSIKLMRKSKRLDNGDAEKYDRPTRLAERLMDAGCTFLAEDAFASILHLEKKRVERSRASFLLMLLDIGEILGLQDKESLLFGAASSLFATSREVDTKGWYRNDRCIGVIFTGINGISDERVSGKILDKIHDALHSHVGVRLANKLKVSMYVFPPQEVASTEKSGSNSAPNIKPDLSMRT